MACGVIWESRLPQQFWLKSTINRTDLQLRFAIVFTKEESRVKVASVCLFVIGIICAGLVAESPPSPPSVNSPRDASQASGESAPPSDAPLVSAFHQKDEPSKKDERIRVQAYLSVECVVSPGTDGDFCP